MSNPNGCIEAAKEELQPAKFDRNNKILALLIVSVLGITLVPAFGVALSFSVPFGVPPVVFWQAMGSLMLGLLTVASYHYVFRPWANAEDAKEFESR